MDIEKYRKEAESFLYKMDKEYYLHFSGIKDSLNVSDIYDEFKDLFGRKYIDHFKNLKEKSTGEEKKKASFLLKFCTEGYMEMYAKDIIDSIAEDEARAKITVDGKKIPFRYSDILLSNEPDKIKRDNIDDKRNKVIAEELNKNLHKYWSSVHGKASELGFSSYSDLFSYLKNEDFSVLQNSMDRLLTETGEFYRDRFGALMQKRSGITLESSRRSDFAYLKRAKKYDGFFKKGILIRVFKDTLAGMGINIIGGALLDAITQGSSGTSYSQTYTKQPQYQPQPQNYQNQAQVYNQAQSQPVNNYSDGYQAGYYNGFKEGYLQGMKDAMRQ